MNADPFFTHFQHSIGGIDLPESLIPDPDGHPHLLCRIAADELQEYLQVQEDWTHNFGLSENGNATGAVIGKMFGVLVVKNNKHEIGYLAAFSGKLAGSNNHARFVPPVYDMLQENGFLNKGMQELTRMTTQIEAIGRRGSTIDQQELAALKRSRKERSIALQQQLFGEYHFRNAAGLSKNINQLFQAAGYRKPPSGAGECAAPKLLQYAFQQNMKPLAIAEFWWGQSPKSAQWKHKMFYPCCKEKCGPILAHMLGK